MNPDFDVAVAGAGAAGAAAAAAAAEAGARVLLVERSDRLGGVVTGAMHRSICGLYCHTPRSPIDTLNGGAQRDVVAKMLARDPVAVKTKQLGRAWVSSSPTDAWESALDDVCSSPSIDRRMGDQIVAVHREQSHIAAIEVDNSLNNARQAFTVGALIDCTGGGAVLQLIGPDVMQPNDAQGRMLCGFSVRLANLTGDLELLRLHIPYTLAKAVDGGLLPSVARFTMFHPGPGEGEGICKLAVNPGPSDTGDVHQFAMQVIEQLKRDAPGFSGARIVGMSTKALARDGRRLLGEVAVTEQDVLEARRHGPQAVHAWWPIERWDVDSGPSYDYSSDGEYYDIPEAAMRSASVTNLLAGGACISATAAAAASLRASGICLATGYAAGLLAARILT